MAATGRRSPPQQAGLAEAATQWPALNEHAAPARPSRLALALPAQQRLVRQKLALQQLVRQKLALQQLVRQKLALQQPARVTAQEQRAEEVWPQWVELAWMRTRRAVSTGTLPSAPVWVAKSKRAADSMPGVRWSLEARSTAGSVRRESEMGERASEESESPQAQPMPEAESRRGAQLTPAEMVPKRDLTVPGCRAAVVPTTMDSRAQRTLAAQVWPHRFARERVRFEQRRIGRNGAALKRLLLQMHIRHKRMSLPSISVLGVS